MKFHATLPTFSAHARNIVRSFCPQCEDLLVAPALSQHVNEDLIRHWWSCEECGHEFRTTVRLPTLPAEAFMPAMA
jgi:RNase P subunit RPR2